MALANDRTKIIPGHGPLSDKAGLTAFRDMMIEAQAAIKTAMKGGKSAGEVATADPLKALNGKWGKGFLKPAHFVRIVISGM